MIRKAILMIMMVILMMNASINGSDDVGDYGNDNDDNDYINSNTT